MTGHEPDVNPENGMVKNNAPLFIQPAVRYHNTMDTLWALAHDFAQTRLWHFQREMNLTLHGIRGFGKFVFDDTYVDVMLKPYAQYPQGRYGEIIRGTELWNKWFEELAVHMEDIDRRLSTGTLSDIDKAKYQELVGIMELNREALANIHDRTEWQNERLAVLGRVLAIPDLQGKIERGGFTDEERALFVNIAYIYETRALYRKLLTFLKSEDEIHTNVTNQAGSHVALLDNNPGANWGGIAAILAGAMPYLGTAVFSVSATSPVLLIWSGIVAFSLGALYVINRMIHGDTIPLPSKGRLVLTGMVAVLSAGLHLWLFSTLPVWGLPLLSFGMATTAAVIMNFGKEEIRGATIYEGFPSDWFDEEERDLKWIGTFDVPNTWARIQGVVGQDVASKYYNDLVNNGLLSEQKWRVLLTMGFWAVLSLGLFEVFLPFAAESNFISIMTILLHLMVTVPLLIYFNKIGRFDRAHPVSSFLKNAAMAYVMLTTQILGQSLEIALSTLIYLNKIFTKDPVLAKSYIGLRAQLRGGDNPWKVAAQIFAIRPYRTYGVMLQVPFAFGFNVLMIFIISAAGLIGSNLAMFVVAPIVTLIMVKFAGDLIVEKYFRARDELRSGGRPGQLEASFLWRKWVQLPFKLMALAVSGATIFAFSNRSYFTGLILLAILATTFAVQFMYNRTIFTNRYISITGKALSGDNLVSKREEISFGEFLSTFGFLMRFAPFVVTLIFIFFSPAIAAIINWEWVLRAAPLLLAFSSGISAVYMASFRFYDETPSGQVKNKWAVITMATLFSLCALAGAVYIGQFPFSEKFNFLPIFAFGPGVDSNASLYTNLLRVPPAFALLHNYITAAAIMSHVFALTLWLLRFISLALPKAFPLRLVQPGEEQGGGVNKRDALARFLHLLGFGGVIGWVLFAWGQWKGELNPPKPIPQPPAKIFIEPGTDHPTPSLIPKQELVFRADKWHLFGGGEHGKANVYKDFRELRISFTDNEGDHQVASVIGDGYLRTTIPNYGWGTAAVFGGMRTSDGQYYPNCKIEISDVEFDESKDAIVLTGRLVDDSGNVTADNLEIKFYPPQPGTYQVKTEVSYTLKAAKPLTLAGTPGSLNFVELRSNAVNETIHDVESVVIKATGKSPGVFVKTMDKTGFLFDQPQPISSDGQIALNGNLSNLKPAISVSLTVGGPEANKLIAVQGYRDPKMASDPNSDNTWAFLAPFKPQESYKAGEEMGVVKATITAEPPSKQSVEAVAPITQSLAANLFGSERLNWLVRVPNMGGIVTHELAHFLSLGTTLIVLVLNPQKIKDLKAFRTSLFKGMPVEIRGPPALLGIIANLAASIACIILLSNGSLTSNIAQYFTAYLLASNLFTLSMEFILPIFKEYRYESDLYKAFGPAVMVGVPVEAVNAEKIVKDIQTTLGNKAEVVLLRTENKSGELARLAAEKHLTAILVDKDFTINAMNAADRNALKKDVYSIKLEKEYGTIVNMAKIDDTTRVEIAAIIKAILDKLGPVDINEAMAKLRSGRISRPAEIEGYLANLQTLVSARKREEKVEAAYYKPLNTTALSGKVIAPVTTEQVVLANMYNGEEMNEAAKQSIVNYVIYGDVAKTEAEARAMIKATGYTGPDNMIECIDKRADKRAYKSYDSLKLEIIARANAREGANAIREADIGIRAAKGELLRKDEKPATETFLEVQEVEMNGTKVLGAMGSYQVLINMVLGKGLPPGVKKDEVTGVFKYLPRALPIDYGREIEEYSNAIKLLCTAA